jgi:hypothetical protein
MSIPEATMTDTALPLPAPASTRKANPTADPGVTWFGNSSRLIGGVPDSRYGWVDTPQGPCIIKALDLDLATYAASLLVHERRMLARLEALGAPAPQWVDMGRADWLATRFAGLSLRRLEDPGRPGLTLAEQLSVWFHLMRRLQPLADAGVVIIDLHSGNVVLPLTQGVNGQLRLNEVGVIDHAHTLEAGMAMRRPVWLDQHMLHIAPELQQAMSHDQQALRDAFSAVGADLPRHSRLPGERDQHSRKVWAEYDAPQQLQALLDSGQIRADAAMQYAIGTAMRHLLARAPDARMREALSQVVARLTARAANDRYPSLDAAADALRQVEPHLPLASHLSWGPVRPADLAGGSKPLRPANPGATTIAETGDGTVMAGDGPTSVTPLRERPHSTAPALERRAFRQRVPMGWICFAAACGAAAAVWTPGPW